MPGLFAFRPTAAHRGRAAEGRKSFHVRFHFEPWDGLLATSRLVPTRRGARARRRRRTAAGASSLVEPPQCPNLFPTRPAERAGEPTPLADRLDGATGTKTTLVSVAGGLASLLTADGRPARRHRGVSRPCGPGESRGRPHARPRAHGLRRGVRRRAVARGGLSRAGPRGDRGRRRLAQPRRAADSARRSWRRSCRPSGPRRGAELSRYRVAWQAERQKREYAETLIPGAAKAARPKPSKEQP